MYIYVYKYNMRALPQHRNVATIARAALTHRMAFAANNYVGFFFFFFNLAAPPHLCRRIANWSPVRLLLLNGVYILCYNIFSLLSYLCSMLKVNCMSDIFILHSVCVCLIRKRGAGSHK